MKIKKIILIIAFIISIFSLTISILSFGKVMPGGKEDKEYTKYISELQSITKISNEDELKTYLIKKPEDVKNQLMAIIIENPQDLSVRINGTLDDEGNAKDIHNIKVFGIRLPFEEFLIDNTEKEIPLDNINEPGWMLVAKSYVENENQIKLISTDVEGPRRSDYNTTIIYHIGKFDDYKEQQLKEIQNEKKQNLNIFLISGIIFILGIIYIIYYYISKNRNIPCNKN